MKNTVMIIISAIIGAVTLAIILNVSGRMNRSMELQSCLPSVVEETLENMKISENRRYQIKSKSEFLSDLVENLAAVTDSDSEIEVRVLRADIEKGLLSVRVSKKFHHTNGNEGTICCDRTVMLNNNQEEKPTVYKVKFYITKDDMDKAEDTYKDYSVCEGDSIIIPADPQMEGKRFVGWKDINDYIADFSLQVEQDLSYYAEWD